MSEPEIIAVGGAVPIAAAPIVEPYQVVDGEPYYLSPFRWREKLGDLDRYTEDREHRWGYAPVVHVEEGEAIVT